MTNTPQSDCQMSFVGDSHEYCENWVFCPSFIPVACMQYKKAQQSLTYPRDAV